MGLNGYSSNDLLGLAALGVKSCDRCNAWPQGGIPYGMTARQSETVDTESGLGGVSGHGSLVVSKYQRRLCCTTRCRKGPVSRGVNAACSFL